MSEATAAAETGAALRIPGDDNTLMRLRSGDEEAFRALVRQHQASLISVAHSFVGNRATADEIVQDTWLAVIEGLKAFEGRSSLKNYWIFAILANKARTRAVRDTRLVAAGSLTGEIEDDQPVVDPSRFDATGNGPIRRQPGTSSPRKGLSPASKFGPTSKTRSTRCRQIKNR